MLFTFFLTISNFLRNQNSTFLVFHQSNFKAALPPSSLVRIICTPPPPLQQIYSCVLPQLLVLPVWQKPVLSTKTSQTKHRNNTIIQIIHNNSVLEPGGGPNISIFINLDFQSFYDSFCTLYILQYIILSLLQCRTKCHWKKSPRNLKLRTFFPVTFCPRTSENWDYIYQSFYFQVYFSRNVFPVTFLHRFE